MKIRQFYWALFCVMAGMYACNEPATKQAEKHSGQTADTVGVRLQEVTGAVAEPVQLCAPGDSANRLFIADHQGKIWIMKNDSLLPRPFLDITVKGSPKSEVLNKINGIAFHPQFASNHKFYVCYNAPTRIKANQTRLVIDEFTEDESDRDSTPLNSGHHIFEMEGKMMYTNGAEIAFGPDGYLYISIGDDAFGDSSYVYQAQDLAYLGGKLLRIDVNKTPYAIPPDNPFVGMKNKRPEIWAYGFRKMWRFTFDPKSKQLFGADVGEVLREEIDIVKKGGNYGWPVMEGDTVFKSNTAGEKSFTAPVNAYTRSVGICIIGGSFYYGNAIPLLQNKYVFGDFNGKLFTLGNLAGGQWKREELNVRNKPAKPFLICGLNAGRSDDLYVMGVLNSKEGPQGIVYKIVKG